jgi:F-type H+-transporting ATPase subunit gamma
MPNIRDLRKRIRTVENIRRITSAMEKIAAARLFRAKAALMNSRPYVNALERMVQDLLNSQPEAVHPLLERNDPATVLLVVATSDRGFCGGYNTRAIETAVQLAEKVGPGKVKFMVFGRKGAGFLSRNGYEILESHTGLPTVFTQTAAEEAGRKLVDLYATKQISEAYLVFTEFVSIGKHVPTVKKLLPIERLPDAERSYMNYAFEPGPAEIIRSILPRFIETQIWSAVMESVVSEHAERMFMMERATKNTDDVIEDLTLVMHKARQAMITRELTDIVGAAETIA